MLYLGAAAGTTVSHVADIVGPSGCVYAVEFAHRPGRDLINMAKSRTNVIPIIEDARHPLKYRMLVGMVDTVFADVAQPDQVRYEIHTCVPVDSENGICRACERHQLSASLSNVCSCCLRREVAKFCVPIDWSMSGTAFLVLKSVRSMAQELPALF